MQTKYSLDEVKGLAPKFMYIEFIIEKLYEFEDWKGTGETT